MEKAELNAVLEKHAKWLGNENGGGRADLKRVDLQGADLKRANLRGANLQGADLQGADLRGADLRGADLKRANLQGADLRGVHLQWTDMQGAYLQNANLRGADLRHANLDFSCLPLWCGSFDMKVSKHQFQQLVYHLCRLDCPEMNDVQNRLRDLANTAPVRTKYRLAEVMHR